MASILKPLMRGPKNNKFNYEPRYQKKENRLENRKTNIKLEKGSFFKHAKTLSKFRGDSLTHYNHNTTSRKNAKYILSILMIGCIYVFFDTGGYPGIAAIGILLILLIVFIRLNNKA
ncbi:MAG: hypothetical protein ACI8ZX_000646 [Planctomycetota bacterium]|jgi:hypothetical protein